jgi:hypothetical protein
MITDARATLHQSGRTSLTLYGPHAKVLESNMVAETKRYENTYLRHAHYWYRQARHARVVTID